MEYVEYVFVIMSNSRCINLANTAQSEYKATKRAKLNIRNYIDLHFKTSRCRSISSNNIVRRRKGWSNCSM